MGNVASPALRTTLESTINNVLNLHPDISPQLHAQLKTELSNQIMVSLHASVSNKVVANNSLSVLCALVAFLAFCLVGRADAAVVQLMARMLESFAVTVLFSALGAGGIVYLLLRLRYLQLPTTNMALIPEEQATSGRSGLSPSAAPNDTVNEEERRKQALAKLLA